MPKLLVVMHARLELGFVKVKVHEVAHKDIEEEQRREVLVGPNVESFENFLSLLYFLQRGSCRELHGNHNITSCNYEPK